MKKYAATLAELLIAMVLMTVLTILAGKTISKSVPDKDILMFRHIFSGVSAAVNNIVGDSRLYPTGNLSDISNVTLRNSTDFYPGAAKFFIAFSDQFNILSYYQNNGTLPLYKTTTSTSITSGKADCFLDNSGITFCMSSDFPNNLNSFYINVFMSDVTYPLMVTLNVTKDGKITFPVTINGYFDCTKNSYSGFSQCIILEGMRNHKFY